MQKSGEVNIVCVAISGKDDWPTIMGVANDGGPRQATWFGIEAEREPEGTAQGPFAGVVFNRPIDQVFSYRIPARLWETVRLGTRLRVPLGRGDKPAVGYCVRLDDALPEDVERVRLKDVLDVLDDPPLIDAAMLELTRWLSGYYACSWGQALDAAVPAGVKKHAGTRVGTFLTVPDEVRQTCVRHAGAAGQAGRGAGDPLPFGRAALDRRRLPDGPLRRRTDRRLAAARPRSHGPAPDSGREPVIAHLAADDDDATARARRR